MKRFIARRVAPVVLASTLVTGGLFVTSAPANAGIVDDCRAAFRTFLDYFRAVDTAAHHEQSPDGRISWNDARATANGHAEIGELPAGQRNLNTYNVLRWAGNLLTTQRNRNNRLMMEELQRQAEWAHLDAYIRARDLQAAVANPGAICA